MSITANLERVRQQVAEACDHARRCVTTVGLMAVSKTHPAEALLEAYEAGQRLFGENRVQEWQGKSAEMAERPAGMDMHLIGPLQNNKTGKAAELFDGVDSLDSVKTAKRLNDACGAMGKILPVLIEVKLSHEESKHGLAAEELSAFLEELKGMGNLRVAGLMTVPPYSEDAEEARPYFKQLRQLREANAAGCPTLTELSMGMSNDFRVAIEEGSTMVRVGTAIFGKRDYSGS